MTIKRAIVSLVIGQKYQDMFEASCRTNWSVYGEKFGYDLIVLPDLFDSSDRAKRRSMAWQKLLILSQPWSSQYEQIVWLDSDLVINNALALDIGAHVPAEKIGAIDAFSIPSRTDYLKLARMPATELWSNLWESPKDYYEKTLTKPALDSLLSRCPNVDGVVQGGVLVCSPKRHRQAFEKAYFDYDDDAPMQQGEQPAMSAEFLKADLVHWLPAEFNYCVAPIIARYYGFLANHAHATQDLRACAIRNIIDMGYFIHFAGCHVLMDLVKPQLTRTNR